MLQGPTADYPHASTACLCYLDRREGKEERNGDAGHRKLSLPHRMVHAVLPEKAESPEPDFSLALQSAVWSKLLWTASFRVEGPSPIQDDSCVVTKFNWHWKDWRGGGLRSKQGHCNGFVPWKIAFCPRPFQARSWLQSE